LTADSITAVVHRVLILEEEKWKKNTVTIVCILYIDRFGLPGKAYLLIIEV
jgi:hypothetical protein